MIQQPAKAQGRMRQASILVRALVHGWRHRGGAHMRVEGVGAAVVIGLDSCDSPSTLSVPRAHSSDQSALGGPLRCSALYASKAPDWQAADHWILAGRTRAVGAGAPDSSEPVQDHHSKRQTAPGHLRRSAELSSWKSRRL